MNDSQISVRYAKALFQSASEGQILDSVHRDMELLSETCRLEDFQFMLMMPSLQPSQKCRLVEGIFKELMTGTSGAMINLVIRNKREAYLPAIARNFNELYRKARGIRTAKLVTAHPVDDAAIGRIKTLIRKTYDAEVDLKAEIDEDVIGGFILSIEDMQYDASVAGSLRRLKKQLLQTSIEKK